MWCTDGDEWAGRSDGGVGVGVHRWGATTVMSATTTETMPVRYSGV